MSNYLTFALPKTGDFENVDSKPVSSNLPASLSLVSNHTFSITKKQYGTSFSTTHHLQEGLMAMGTRQFKKASSRCVQYSQPNNCLTKCVLILKLPLPLGSSCQRLDCRPYKGHHDASMNPYKVLQPIMKRNTVISNAGITEAPKLRAISKSNSKLPSKARIRKVDGNFSLTTTMELGDIHEKISFNTIKWFETTTINYRGMIRLKLIDLSKFKNTPKNHYHPAIQT